MKSTIITFFLFFLFAIALNAQDFQSVNFNGSNGLSSSQVYDVIQDDWGYIWISSDHGLNRYDGEKFDLYGIAEGLPDNTVFNFFKDEDGLIWCTTLSNKLFSISGKDPVFTDYPYNHYFKDYPGNLVVSNIYVNREAKILTFLNSGGYVMIFNDGTYEEHLTYSNKTSHNILLYDQNGTGISYKFHEGDAVPVPKGFRNKQIAKDLLSSVDYFSRPGGLFFSENQTYFFLSGENLIKMVDGKTERISIGTSAIHIRKLNSNEFWVSTRGSGILVFDKNGNKLYSLAKEFSGTALFEDHEKGKWVTTLENGIYYYRNPDISFLSPSLNTGIKDLEIDGQGTLWVSTLKGDVFRYANEKWLQIHDAVLKKPALLCKDEHGTIYYSSDKYLYKHPFNDSLRIGDVFYKLNWSEFEGKKGVLSFSGFYTKFSSFESKEIRLIVESFSRILDMQTVNDSLFVVGQAGLQFFNDEGKIVVLDSLNEALCSSIKDICSFGPYAALATKGKGLLFYNKGNVLSCTAKEGLSSNYCTRLFAEGDSLLWVGTNQGLNLIRFDQPDSFNIKTINFDDGLISNEVNSIAINNDTVWLGTSNGINRFLKSYLFSDKEPVNNFLKIDRVWVNDEMSGYKLSELNYDQNRLQFSFSGISFSSLENLEYRYCLKGLEDDWVYTNNKNIIYPELQAGEYEFCVQLKATNLDWGNQQASLKFSIHPPFWKTWWFLLLMLSLFTGIVYLFFRYRILIYNADIVREILRQLLKVIRKDSFYLIVVESGSEVKILTNEILFVKSAGNYIEIHTEKGKHTVREKIGKFLDLVPDPLEFIRVKRSFIVRIDKVSEKGKKHVVVGNEKIMVGETYLPQLQKILLA